MRVSGGGGPQEENLPIEAGPASPNSDFTDVLDRSEAGGLIIRGTLLRAGGYLLGLLLALASSAVVLRHLGVVDAGRLITILALVTIVGGISDLGLSSLALREYSTLERTARERFMRNVLGLRLICALVGVAGATAFAAIAGYTRVMVVGTVLAGAGVIVGLIQQNLAVALSVGLRLGWVTTLTLLGQIGVTVGFVALALAGAGLLPFFAVQTVAWIPVVAVTVLLVRGAAFVRPSFDRPEWRRIMSELLVYALAVVLYVLYFRFAVISVSLLSTPEETGYYGASFRVLDALSLIPLLLASSAFPLLARAARDDHERLRYALGRLFQAMVILGIWIAVCLALGAQVAIDLVAGPGFDPAVRPLRIQALAILGTSMLAVWGYGLLSLRRHRAILLANLVSLAVAVSLSISLIPEHGAVGAAIALTAAELGLAAGYGFALLRAEPALLGSLKVVPRVFAAAGLGLAAPRVAGLTDIAAVAAATGVYFVALLGLRAVPWELRDALFRPRA